MRLRRANRFRLFALAAALALVLAACGDGRDDDDDSAGGDDDSTTATTAAGEEDGEAEGGATFEIDTANCITDPTTVEITGDTIKLGTSLPQSGIYAAFTEILRGEQAYIQYVNEEKGGFAVGDTQYQVELVAMDDAYAAEQTVSNANTLINDDQVFGLFNVVGTKNNLAIRDLVNEACVPNLFAATGSPAWGNPAYPWLEGTFLVPYPLEMQALVDYLGENMPAATIADPAGRRRLRRFVLRDVAVVDRGHRSHDRGRGDLRPRDRGSRHAGDHARGEPGRRVRARRDAARVPGVAQRARHIRLGAARVHVGNVHVEDAHGCGRCQRQQRAQFGVADGPERSAVRVERSDDALQGEARAVPARSRRHATASLHSVGLRARSSKPRS